MIAEVAGGTAGWDEVEVTAVREASRRSPRVLKAVLLVLVVVVLLGAAFAAGLRTARLLEATAPEQPKPAVATVSTQTVGQAFNYDATVTRASVPIAENHLSGVVTQISDANVFKVGDILYTVGGVPVWVVEGTTPFYRDIGPATPPGPDVAELRRALHQLGYLQERSGDSVDLETLMGLEDWQRSVGLPPSGTLKLGELVAIPTTHFPVRLSLDRKVVRVGMSLAGGEPVIESVGGTPSFSLVVSPDQAQLIADKTPVTITFGKNKWDARAGTRSNDDQGNVVLKLVSATGGGPVCGSQCNALPDQTTLELPAAVVVVPPTMGPAVPIAALATHPDGSASVMVVGAGGKALQQTVKIRASEDGVAIVSGLHDGQRVEVFGGK